MNIPTISCKVNNINLICTITTLGDDLTEHHCETTYDESSCSHFRITSQMAIPKTPYIYLHVEKKALGAAGYWTPNSGFRKNLEGDWKLPEQVSLSHSAPVICFFDYSARNCFTFAISEVSRDISYIAGIHEETGDYYIDLLISFSQPMDHYHLFCRFDCRPLPFYTTVRDTASWWDALLPDVPISVPEAARLPMYSTWYSYHQDMTDEALYRECQMAVEMGMQAVIIDDGWQTTDNSRGYGFCGDWKPAVSKFPDFKAFIRKIHTLGMKCLIWYSVPFIGEHSGIWTHFKNMLLSFNPAQNAGVLDPRYASVREYLITTYENAVTDWDLDGLKLDFIDSFQVYPETPAYNDKMDFQEVTDAVYCLMTSIYKRLKSIKSDLLIEFRQTYTGPQMRRFGNIFRVLDCPLSGITNRVNIADLKLTAGNSAVHSDMLMWHPQETPENIAIQLINCIFGVLQISVKLNTLSCNQRRVLEHYLKFAIRYREILQQGEFMPQNPLALYPIVSAYKDKSCIIAVYDADRIIALPHNELINDYWLLNGCQGTFLILSAQKELYCSISVFNCMGECILKKETALSNMYTISVPAGGSISLHRQNRLEIVS